MCFCDPSIKTPFCNSFECQNELKRLHVKDLEELSIQKTKLSARLQLMMEWIEKVNKATGIEPPEEFFKWFDKDGVPKV